MMSTEYVIRVENFAYYIVTEIESESIFGKIKLM